LTLSVRRFFACLRVSRSSGVPGASSVIVLTGIDASVE
jgi:hypothetical protein